MKKSIILAGILIGTLFGQTIAAAGTEDAAYMTSEQENSSNQEEPSQDKQEESTDVELYIDNQTVYEGMDTSYSNGYIPKEREDSVEIILPLLHKGEILNKEIRVSPNIGDTQENPFIYKNYDMYVKEKEITTAEQKAKKSVYYIKLTLELKQERMGGTFPITWEISGESIGSKKFKQTFTTYVNVTEKMAEEKEEAEEEKTEIGETGEEANTAQNGGEINAGLPEDGITQEDAEKKSSPKLLHIGTTCEEEEVVPGESAVFHLQFQNMSEKENINNVSLSVTSQEKDISILNESTVWYFEHIGHKETIEISVEVLVQMGIETDAFTLQYKAAYENGEAEQLTEEGTVAVKIRKIPKVTAEMTKPNKQIYVGDAIAVKGSFMNTGAGKAYNVTISLTAEGLKFQNTMFIGEIESRDAAEADGILLVDGKEGKDKYGEINGTYRISYSDELGKEYVEEIPFTTELQPPILLSDNDNKKEGEKMSVQWWITIGILAEIIMLCLAYFLKKVKENHDK